MGIKTVTVRQVECDRCKGKDDTGQMEGRNAWGELNIAYKGHTGGRAYDGAAGGVNHQGKAWLCMHCTQAFFAFMRPT